MARNAMNWILTAALALIAVMVPAVKAPGSEELFEYKVWIKTFSQENGGFEIVLNAKEPLRYRVSIAGQLPIPPQKPIPPLAMHFNVRNGNAVPIPFEEGGYGFRTVSPSGRARLDWTGKWIGVTPTPPGAVHVQAAFSYQELRNRLVNGLGVLAIEVEARRAETKDITVLHLSIPLKEILALQTPPSKPAGERRKNDGPVARTEGISPSVFFSVFFLKHSRLFGIIHPSSRTFPPI